MTHNLVGEQQANSFGKLILKNRTEKVINNSLAKEATE